ncbi:MAG: succinate dehydrogenase assembly factor 2 [Hyphomicrobiales bacterium]
MTSDYDLDDYNRRRKLVFRANHRGMKEMDVVLGGYVKRHIDRMSSDDLEELERIIVIPDADLLAWLTKQQEVPEEHRSQLLDEILAFTTTPDNYTSV